MSGERKRPIWIVKLGQSLFDVPELKTWLSVLAEPRPDPMAPAIIVVPGGGPFVEAVRTTQPVLKYGAAAAHRMALLAMEQFAIALADLEPRLRMAASADQLNRLRAEGATALWLPSRMVLGWYDVPESWEVASDSLAAWLAAELKASLLVMVKAESLPESELVASTLVERQIVDRALPELLSRLKAPTWCMGRDAHARFAKALAGGPLEGTRVKAG
ncbi:MAG TPA: aspartate/glutamate/uridylate kinase [Azospirillaceae bacterium]|nr:aspartate/glutamate/uridylate kinase [Azospirillaceae bacterium]